MYFFNYVFLYCKFLLYRILAFLCSYELKGFDVIWATKDSSITFTFVDAGAAQFFPTFLNEDLR